jgi:hypothetical protein
MTQTTRPSSHVLSQIEGALHRRYQLQVQVDQLLAGIAILNEKAETLALDEFGQDLAPAAIMMAERSLPSIVALMAQKEQPAATAVTDSEQPRATVPTSTTADPARVLVEPSHLQPSAPVVEADAVVTSDDFLGVAVPAGRTDEAYDILEEAKTSFRQGQKSNPYATNRGKNSWRNALFAKALENYFETGLGEGVDTDDHGSAATEGFVVETPVFDDDHDENDVIADQDADASLDVDPVNDTSVAVPVFIEVEAAAVSSDEDLSSAPASAIVETDEDADEDDHEPEAFVPAEDIDHSAAIDAFDNHLPDFDEIPDDVDDADTAIEPVVNDVATPVDAATSETPQETSLDQTFTLDETFFSDDVAHSDPLTIETEPSQVEGLVSEPAAVSPSVTPVADDMTGAPMRIPPSAAARAVSVASLPPAMRPAAMARPQPQPTPAATKPLDESNPAVVEQAPAVASAPQARPVMARPAAPVSVPRPAVVAPASVTTKPVETARPTPQPSPAQVAARPNQAPVTAPAVAPRPGFARPQPSTPAPVANRQPGYGATVTKAPEGLEKALEEQRKAEEAKANGSAAPAPRPVAPPRPGAPIRPSFAPPIRR